MSVNLKSACLNLWRTKYERKGIQAEFKPDFVRYVGVDNTTEYDSVLKTLISKVEADKEHSIYFDSQIPMTAEFDLMSSVKNELATMDVTHISTQDITLFSDPVLNNIFLNSLEYVVNLAIKQEGFFNDSVRNNFICKMILYAYLYIFNLKFEDDVTNKCIYYGPISKQDIYFLILLYRMTFDVLYINPARDEFWDQVDTDHLSEQHKSKQVMPVDTLALHISRGQILEINESMTLQFERQIEDEMFTGTGVYKPWQFKDGNTSAVFFSSTIIDMKLNWKEPAKVRQGFRVDGKTVYVPHFFYEVEGENRNFQEYCETVQTCTKTLNTMVSFGDESDFVETELSNNDKYQLMFCQLSNGEFDPQEIRKLPFYPYEPYNDNTEDFMLSKLNETMRDSSLFKSPINSKEERMNFAATILCLNKKIVRLIDSFDFTNEIPKVVIFLEGEKGISKNIAYVLAYLNTIGFDIVIFTPAGLSNLNTFIDETRFNSTRLDLINYERTYESTKKQQKKGFFNKLFGL